jgi:hypothetical protein
MRRELSSLVWQICGVVADLEDTHKEMLHCYHEFSNHIDAQDVSMFEDSDVEARKVTDSELGTSRVTDSEHVPAHTGRKHTDSDTKHTRHEAARIPTSPEQIVLSLSLSPSGSDPGRGDAHSEHNSILAHGTSGSSCNNNTVMSHMRAMGASYCKDTSSASQHVHMNGQKSAVKSRDSRLLNDGQKSEDKSKNSAYTYAHTFSQSASPVPAHSASSILEVGEGSVCVSELKAQIELHRSEVRICSSLLCVSMR